MICLGRERRIDFVLSSYVCFLSRTHEGQWVQYYIYCQNDPVSLIDPTGYSPENTGTPIRFTPKNYSNLQSSEGGMNSCYMEDYTLTVAAVQNPDGSNINLAEAGRQAAWRDAEHRRNEHQDLLIEGMFDSNDGCYTKTTIEVAGTTITIYSFEIDGEMINMFVDKDGKIVGFAPKNPSSQKGKAIANGLNDAMYELNQAGIKIDPIDFIAEIQYFARNHFSMFDSFEQGYLDQDWVPGPWNNKPGRAPKGYEKYYRFAYHATRGYGIATKMGNVNDVHDANGNPFQYSEAQTGTNSEFQLKMMIGFAVSYMDRTFGTNLGLLESELKNGDKTLGLVHVANLILATIGTESSFNYKTNWDGLKKNSDGSIDIGLMQLNFPAGTDIEKLRRMNFFDPFKNIFYGTGWLYKKVRMSTGDDWKPGDGPLTQLQWQKALYYYQGAGVGRKVIWENMRRISGDSWIIEWDDNI